MKWALIGPMVIVASVVIAGCADRSDQAIGYDESDGGTSGDDSSLESTSEDWSESSDTGGCEFASCIDMAAICSSRGLDSSLSPRCSCDIWAQDCVEGEKCTAYDASGGSSWNANKCVPVDPAPGQPGEVCQITQGGYGNDTCDVGGICWDVDPETMEGYCVALCDGTPNTPICAGDTVCAILHDGVLPICLADCDPLAIDCPKPGNLCVPHPSDGGFVCFLDGSGGAGTYGAECSYANACNPGLYCAAAEEVPGCGSDACCSEFCDINLPNSCAGIAGGQECVPWWEMGMAPMGLEHVGGCAVP